MHTEGPGIAVAIRIEVGMVMVACHTTIEHLDGADLHDTVSLCGIESGRFCIKNDPTHR